MKRGPKAIPLAVRVWKRITKTDTCWLWAEPLRAGYGMIKNEGGRPVGAHRVVYELLVGPIPDGLHLDHLCRVRNCVNPTHLEPVTRRENILRGESFAAANRAKTHCPQGHEYNGMNTRVSQSGKRHCRPCDTWRTAERRLRVKEDASL